MLVIKEIEDLINTLKSLPNITSKQAEKIVYYLLNSDDDFVSSLINNIKDLRKNLQFCNQWNTISLTPICQICSNKARNQNQLCIVATSNDVDKIEATNSYSGLYFVLHQEISVKSKTPLNQNLTSKLLNLINKKDIKEIIIATNWTPDGEATAIFLKELIKHRIGNKVNIFRLAVGLPINSALNYADNETLTHALKNKTQY